MYFIEHRKERAVVYYAYNLTAFAALMFAYLNGMQLCIQRSIFLLSPATFAEGYWNM